MAKIIVKSFGIGHFFFYTGRKVWPLLEVLQVLATLPAWKKEGRKEGKVESGVALHSLQRSQFLSLYFSQYLFTNKQNRTTQVFPNENRTFPPPTFVEDVQGLQEPIQDAEVSERERERERGRMSRKEIERSCEPQINQKFLLPPPSPFPASARRTWTGPPTDTAWPGGRTRRRRRRRRRTWTWTWTWTWTPGRRRRRRRRNHRRRRSRRRKRKR